MPEFLTPTPAGLITAILINNLLLITATLSPAIVGANTTAEQTFPVIGLPANIIGGVVVISKPTAQAGLGIVGARITAGNINITFSNNTAGGITPTAAEIYSFLVVQG